MALPLKDLDSNLYDAYTNLFDQSEAFFHLPEEVKMKHHIPARQQQSEEGFSVVAGEKSLITVRRTSTTPEILLKATQDCWSASVNFLSDIMDQVSRSLGMETNRFEDMIKPCSSLPEKDRVATLVRMFRYIRPEKGKNAKIVAEPHRDLGLLTIVVGSSAGLEVFEPDPADSKNGGKWISIEEEQTMTGDLTCTLLSGATLARLSNGLYTPGRHRVFVHPSTDEAPSPYRFSLVFALRAHLPVVVSSRMFTTDVTGPYIHPFGEDREAKMGDIYQAISNAHFNINIDKSVREEQRQKVLRSGDHQHSHRDKAKERGSDVSDRLKGRKWSLRTLFRRVKITS